MKVLFAPAHRFLSDKYGSEFQWSYKILDTMSKKGIDVVGIIGEADLESPLNQKVKLYSTMPSHRRIVRGYERVRTAYINPLKFTLGTYSIGRKVLREEKIDIVHHLRPLSPFTFNLLAILNEIKDIPFVIGPVLPPQKYFSQSERPIWFTSWRGVFLNNLLVPLGRRPSQFLFRKTLEKANKIICATQMAKRYYSKFVMKEKLEVIPVGVDTERFIPKVNRNSGDSPNLLAVGYLIKRKGFHILIQSLKRVADEYPHVTLRILGNGPEEINLRKLAKKLGLTRNIKFLGFIPNLQTLDYYQSCDIFCNPTLYEAVGQVNLEAMACGKPVIGTNVGALPEIITNDVGILVEKENPEQLANAIIRLIENRKMRNQMGKNARKRVEKNYSWDVVINQYIQVYEEMKSG